MMAIDVFFEGSTLRSVDFIIRAEFRHYYLGFNMEAPADDLDTFSEENLRFKLKCFPTKARAAPANEGDRYFLRR